MQLIYSLRLLMQLLVRDFYVFGKRIASFGINYLLIYPILAIVTFGYIQPGVYFGPGHTATSIILLVGTFGINMLSLCYTMMSSFVFDLEHDRFIDYQISIVTPRILLLKMILFPALIASMISLPYFPLAYLILPSYFANLNSNWLALMAVIVCASLYCASYIMMGLCIIKKATSIRQFWLRCNWPLVVLGGLWIPWHLLRSNYPRLAYVSLLDPFTYFTEGIRSALIGSDQFISYKICICALLVFFCIFSLVSIYFFKKKLDHV
jgi:ABC-2 type transport system permease protein